MWFILQQIGVYLLRYWRYLLVLGLGCASGWILHRQLSPLPQPLQPQTQLKQSSLQNITKEVTINKKIKKKVVIKKGKITEKFNNKGVLVEKTTVLPTYIDENVKEESKAEITNNTLLTNTDLYIDNSNNRGRDSYMLGVQYKIDKSITNWQDNLMAIGNIRIHNSPIWLGISVGKNKLLFNLTATF